MLFHVDVEIRQRIRPVRHYAVDLALLHRVHHLVDLQHDRRRAGELDRSSDGLVGSPELQALQVRKGNDSLVARVDQAGIVHEEREHLVIVVFLIERAALIEAPQRLGAALRIAHHEGQLDDRGAGKALAFRAAQAQCNVDRAVLGLRALLQDIAVRRGAIENLDRGLAAGLVLQPLGPRLRHVALEEALRSEEMAELERDALRRGAARDEKQKNK